MAVQHGITIAPSEDLQPSPLPLFPSYGVYIDALDYAVRYELAQIDLRGIAQWFNPDAVTEAAIGPMLSLFGVEELDTTILGIDYRRTLYRNNWVYRNFRGTEFVLNEFSRTTGIAFSFTLIRSVTGRATEVDISIQPPIGRAPNTAWQSFMRRAFIWLLPPDVALRNLEVGINVEDNIYIYSNIKFGREVTV